MPFYHRDVLVGTCALTHEFRNENSAGKRMAHVRDTIENVRWGCMALAGTPMRSTETSGVQAPARLVPFRARLSLARLCYQALSGLSFALVSMYSIEQVRADFAGLELRNFNMGRGCPVPPYHNGFVYTGTGVAQGTTLVLERGSQVNATFIVLSDLPPVSKVELYFGAAYAMFFVKGVLATVTAATHINVRAIAHSVATP